MVTLTLILLIVASATAVDSYVRVCYYTNWSQYRNGAGKYFLNTDYQDGLCTHIIFSFAKVEKLGAGYGIAPYEWNDHSRLYKDLNEKVKQRDRNLKSLLAIGGWTHSSNGFTGMVATRASRKYFIDNAIDYLQEHGFDGLDLDWEFPAQRGGPAVDKQRFTYLCQELKAAFAPKGLLLTAAVTANVNRAGISYEIQKVAQSLDFINLMTYDFHGSWEKTTGHHTDTNPGRAYPTEHSLYNTVNHWISSGVPSNKLVLGLASYGRTWKLQSTCEWDIGSSAAGAGQSGPFTKESGFMAYYEICNQNFLNKVCSDSSSVYAPYGTTSTTFIGYDDPESIVYKINNVMKAFNMGGYMFWAIDLDDFQGSCGQGRYPLLNAAKNAALGTSQNLPRCSSIRTCPTTPKPPPVGVTPPKRVKPAPTPGPVTVFKGTCQSTMSWRSSSMDQWCRIEAHCMKACQSPCPDQALCDRCECIRDGVVITTRGTTTRYTTRRTTRKPAPTPPPTQPPTGQNCRPLPTNTASWAISWCATNCYKCKTSKIYGNYCVCA